jgi:hypothetical protein
MIGFALTPRRRETLEILQRLTEQAGEAVHYSLVGARMRISAWTAYGLLRELENMGLVVRRYALEPGKRLGGRSRILFEPAAHRRSLDGEPRASVFVESYNRFRAIPDEAMAATAYLAEAGSDIGFHLGFWLGRLEAAGRPPRASRCGRHGARRERCARGQDPDGRGDRLGGSPGPGGQGQAPGPNDRRRQPVLDPP